MKLLATVIALAAARKDSCTNSPPAGTVIPGMDGYVVTAEEAADWSACGPNADCEKIRGWNFSCSCKAGFIDYDVNDYRKNSCYDSCFTAETPDNATCDVDSEGNAFWTCNEGYYQATVDVEGSTEATEEVCFFDSCATDPCADNADCAADGDSHVCSCSDDFFDFNGDVSLCVPDNCATGAHGCDVDATCTVDLPVNGTASNSCDCNAGFYGDGEECFVDSCALNPCQADATCANVGDEYTCTCNAGFYLGYAPFEGSGEGSTWTDPAACHVDVCASANPCDADAACTNNDDGSQSCACNDGFYGDGNECFFDSCATNPCQADSTCANDGDDFSCTCNAGFYYGTNTIEGSTGDFRDEDACHVDVCASANPCDTDATCSNNVDGSQSCVCNDGFYGNGAVCFVDSCALSPCQADSTCANEGDSFSCTCNAGFYLGHTTVEGSTGDFRDEVACHFDICDSESNPCDANASCTNNADGSQSCACNFDFKGDGFSCTDIGSLNKAELDTQLAAFTAEAAGLTDAKVISKFNKAMKKYPMGHVDNYEAECMNKREVRTLVEEFEADDLDGAEDELLGWDLSDACSYAKDLATANKRFLKRWACVSQWNFNADAKDLKKENKNLNKKIKKVEKKIVQFKKKLDKELSC